MSNTEFLDWFGEDERSVCPTCRQQACVRLPDVPARFCLACGAITIGGLRIDVRGTVATDF